MRVIIFSLLLSIAMMGTVSSPRAALEETTTEVWCATQLPAAEARIEKYASFPKAVVGGRL